MKEYLIDKMEKYLENMCAYHATGNKQLFAYYAGMADGVREVLEECYNWHAHNASDHIKEMWDIMDENW